MGSGKLSKLPAGFLPIIFSVLELVGDSRQLPRLAETSLGMPPTSAGLDKGELAGFERKLVAESQLKS